MMRHRHLVPAALVALLCFGCATTRPPTRQGLALVGAAPARVALAEPELELWMEGTGSVDASQADQALDASRAAFAAALEDRGFDELDAPDALLQLRARAVARTSERRAAQVWTVVGIVVVVAAVVAAIVICRDDPPRPTRRRVLPAPSARGVGPWRARPHVRAGPSFFWGVGVHVGIPVGPAPLAGPGDDGALAADELLDGRGWFDGDEVELTAELVDPASGDVRWRRVVREGVDPRDRQAFRRLVDRALEGLPWADL